MATKKAPVTEAKAAERDEWDDAREILVTAGTAVREGLELNEIWEGVYLGYVLKESENGPVRMHLMQTLDGVQAMWGHHSLDEAFGRCSKGVRTRIDGRGWMELSTTRKMRLIRARQLGMNVEGAPVIMDPVAEAASVYDALGIDPNAAARVDPDTGEIFPDLSNELNIRTAHLTQ